MTQSPPPASAATLRPQYRPAIRACMDWFEYFRRDGEVPFWASSLILDRANMDGSTWPHEDNTGRIAKQYIMCAILYEGDQRYKAAAKCYVNAMLRDNAELPSLELQLLDRLCNTKLHLNLSDITSRSFSEAVDLLADVLREFQEGTAPNRKSVLLQTYIGNYWRHFNPVEILLHPGDPLAGSNWLYDGGAKVLPFSVFYSSICGMFSGHSCETHGAQDDVRSVNDGDRWRGPIAPFDCEVASHLNKLLQQTNATKDSALLTACWFAWARDPSTKLEAEVTVPQAPRTEVVAEELVAHMTDLLTKQDILDDSAVLISTLHACENKCIQRPSSTSTDTSLHISRVSKIDTSPNLKDRITEVFAG
jgi:hypothetical protein